MKTEMLLDYATFQLDEARTRCELWVTAGSETERLASGSLKPFLAHLSEAQNQILQGQTSIKLQVPPVASNGRAFALSWFTKGTVERFVRFVTTPDVLERVSIVETERRQLEEAIGILSMGDQQAKQGADGEDCIDGDPAADGSKNQLLVAMDARRIMLQKEQENAFARAAAAGFDMGCMADLMDFAECFGASRLREACLKFASIYKKVQASDAGGSAENDSDVRSSKGRKAWGGQDLHQGNLDAVPQDTATPAASLTPMSNGLRGIPDSPPNFEDRSPSTEGTNSQLETPSSTRRLPRRSASPRRRSCSPMRKVQIGRSATRKPSMVVIRNINYATTSFQGSGTANQAAEGTDDSESDSAVKSEDSSEERHRRLSVQDAINLFERRQKEVKDVKVEARRESGKSVLRRWSSIGDHGIATASDAGTPSLTPCQEPADDGQFESWEKEEPESISKRDERRKSWVTTTLDLERTFQQLKLQEAALKSAKVDQKASQGRLSHRGDRNSVSKSWSAASQQELVTLAQQSELETKQKQETSSRMRDQGRFYEQYREVRDAKIRQESGLKRAEREKLKAMQEALEKRKAELVVGGGRLGEKLNSSSREPPEKLPAAKAQPLRKGTAKSQQATRPTSRTSPTLSSAQVVAVPRVPRQTPAEQKTSSARKLSPSAYKASSVRGITSSPKSIIKQQTTAPTQRRTVSSTHGLPDNPLTRSMPSLAELRKENTRPGAVRGAALPQQSSKIPSTRSTQTKPAAAVTRPRAASKVMPLEPNGMVASEFHLPAPEERSRKSWKKPAEVEGVLAPLKEAQLEISPVVVSQAARDFLRPGRGIGPVEAPDAIEVLASATDEQVKPQQDFSPVQAEPVSTLEGITEPEACGSVRESLEMDIDDNEPMQASQVVHHEPLRSIQAQLQSNIQESQQSRAVLPSTEFKAQHPGPSTPAPLAVVLAAPVERSSSTLSQGAARKMDAKQLTLMQQLAGDDFVDSSQLSSLPEFPMNNRRASLPSLGPSTSPTLVATRHSLSPDTDGVKTERRKWGHKPAMLAHQLQQSQLNLQFQQLQQLQQQQQQAYKEGPKGFKKLLKFGRKSRGPSAGAAEWVSASTTSEGEDTDDSGSHPHQNGPGPRSSFFSFSNFRSKTADSSKSKS